MRAREVFLWLGCLGVAYASVSASRYELKDPDSTLYEAMADDLGDEDASEWIDPTWPSGRAKSGAFQEHLAVFLWPSAALEAAGFERGALLWNMVCWILLVFALRSVAASFGADDVAASAAVLLFALSPFAIQYTLRANHEPLWAAISLFAISAARRGDAPHNALSSAP